MTGKVKLTVVITAEEMELLKSFAEEDGSNITTTLRRILKTEQVLREKQKAGGTIYIKMPRSATLLELIRV